MVTCVPGLGDTTIAGRYRVLHALGQGGMGTIWLAHDELLDRQVAIKEVLLPQSLDAAARSEALQRTMREAMAAAQLRHPGIITIHDVLSEDGRPWIVMELLKGRDLKQAVATEGPWAPERAADLGLRVLDALNAAHARGIQHRDVKPANVFLTDDGRVVLTDFGIARLEDEATITASGLLVGSPGFIAPERLRGERGGPESDLWSLAATLYAAVEGRAPYVGTSPLSILREALTRPPDPPMRAGHLGPVLMAMMAREPYQRPGAQAAEQLLRRVAEGGQALAPPPAKRSNRVPILVGGGIVAVAAAAVAVVALMPGDKPNRPPKVSGAAHPTQTTEKPTPTPTPSKAEEARFHAPVNLCRTLTAKQIAALVPGAPQGKRDGNSCEWTLRGIGLSIQSLDVDEAPDPWSAELDPAKEEYVNKSNALSQGAKITWQWPEIGLKKGITQPRTHFKDLKGIGDEAFTYDLVNPKGQAEHVTVVFRVSNVNIEIDYVNVNRIGKGDTLSQGARGAARWVADRLNRSTE
ncbi:serine/threonine-protein kinase [Nonomuraea sediminis]|uniref:serine/threonine-protein kinase n=1 Tax=Nonomuraea sediminis TaxID=2835864 RepID=UPI0023DE8481|nr:serine/threonine-protein kinase [Nonomuraea sediminis]